jgi:hypothetical protein
MNKQKTLSQFAGGDFEQMLRAVLGKLSSPSQVTESLATLGREHAGKAALGAGAAGAAAGAGAGYLTGSHRAKKNLTMEDIVKALQNKVGLGKNATKTAKASDFLTPEERMQLLHSGALLKCADSGMDKQAIFDSVGSIFDAGTKAVVVASAVTGIPIGIMAHLMGKATRGKRMQEQELQHKTQFYRNAGQQFERNLANQGVQV